jgi:3-oxoadipate CoA-transferase, beta subunit
MSVQPWTMEQVAQRIAEVLWDGAYVNLGIGLPQMVTNYLSPDREVVYHAEHGLLGMGPEAKPEEADPNLTDAGANLITLVPGASVFSHDVSFAMIRGGHIDVAVMGAYQVSGDGDLANWAIAGQSPPPGVGGAMDLAVGAKNVFVMMRHQDKNGAPKVVRECSYPLTAERCVDRIFTDLAVMEVTPEGLLVVEMAPGLTLEDLRKVTEPPLRMAVELRWGGTEKMASDLGWAVVGTGAHVVGRMAPALSRARGTRLAAVYSREVHRAEQIARQFGFARSYDSYPQMLKDDSVDVVYICTPNALHAEQAIEAARAGKHVLVEKPMALTTADAEAVVEACDAAGVRLGVGFHLRHHPAHREARAWIAGGNVGHIFLLDARWVVAGPQREGWWQDPRMVGAYAFMAVGVHLVDLVCYLSGQEPVEVAMHTDAQGADKPLELTAVATIRLAGGSLASLAAVRGAAGLYTGFNVYGTAGNIQSAGTIGALARGSVQFVTPDSRREEQYDGPDPFQSEIEAFNRSVAEGIDPEASGPDGLKVVRVTEALLESARTGRTVGLS